MSGQPSVIKTSNGTPLFIIKLTDSMQFYDRYVSVIEREVINIRFF